MYIFLFYFLLLYTRAHGRCYIVCIFESYRMRTRSLNISNFTTTPELYILLPFGSRTLSKRNHNKMNGKLKVPRFKIKDKKKKLKNASQKGEQRVENKEVHGKYQFFFIIIIIITCTIARSNSQRN